MPQAPSTSPDAAASPDAGQSADKLRLGLPKGRMHDNVVRLLDDAGLNIRASTRGYRPRINLPHAEVKILKPQNVVEMLDAGSRDVGFAGADWVAELKADVQDILDTGFDPVRLVAAAPRSLITAEGQLPDRPLRVAGEYPELITRWLKQARPNDIFVRSFGATEVFPPEDADYIVDVTQSGATLEANNLVIVDELFRSSTRLFASNKAMADPARKQRIDDLAVLLRSVLEARTRVLLEVNVGSDALDAVVKVLPCMREPTIAQLHDGAGYAVRVAVPKHDVPAIIPSIKAAGGTDIVIIPLAQVVP
ncbi:MAG: ATP phosphoribosyltransferase [Planctomycetota bacterium]